MPRYDFHCTDCRDKFELQLSLAEREDSKSEKKVCPKCQSMNISQAISAGNIIGSTSSSNSISSTPSCSTGKCPFAR